MLMKKRLIINHQHFLAGFLQNNNSFVAVEFEILSFLDLDADLETLCAKSLNLDLLEVAELADTTGSKFGDSFGVGSSVFNLTNANENTTVLPGSADL
ncbi:unnamed protein product [[Candida] boidinii]|nr:unnamed protein product [[Candida] boidinii]